MQSLDIISYVTQFVMQFVTTVENCYYKKVIIVLGKIAKFIYFVIIHFENKKILLSYYYKTTSVILLILDMVY